MVRGAHLSCLNHSEGKTKSQKHAELETKARFPYIWSYGAIKFVGEEGTRDSGKMAKRCEYTSL